MSVRRLLLVAAVALLVPTPGRADVGLIVLEPVDALGFVTRVGHVATYFSNICPDDSPVRMRLCRPGEQGGVVSKYTSLSEREDYDWAIVPFEAFLHGFAAPELAPLIGTPRLQRTIEEYQFGALFGSALSVEANGAPPLGHWRAALATRFDRALYIYTVKTTVADDEALVAAFNAAPNRSRFNFFYRNCSDQAREIFDLILPDIDVIGDRVSGVAMQTPKGLAKAMVARAVAHPELGLHVRRYSQVPGTYARSPGVLFPMENTYRSPAFLPWWFFGGYRDVAFGSMLYHEVLSPFRLRTTVREFRSPLAARLTLEQRHLRAQQDGIRRALQVMDHDDRRWPQLVSAEARVFTRLAEIRREQAAEVTRVEGSAERWRELAHGVQALARSLGERPEMPEPWRRRFARYEPGGTLSKQVLDYVEAEGRFFVAGGGPWVSVRLGDAEVSTGLSTSQILSGDTRLSVLILAAVLDYDLSQSPGRRDDIDDVERLAGVFRRAVGATGLTPVAGRSGTAPAPGRAR